MSYFIFMKNNIYALIIISFHLIDDANWFWFIKPFKRLLKFIDYLSNPILLRVVKNSQLPPDALSYTKVNELLGGILTPIVRSHDSDFLPCLVLHKRFELLESTEDLSFGLHEENSGLSREVIIEYNIV
jgi:hypothetical protein